MRGELTAIQKLHLITARAQLLALRATPLPLTEFEAEVDKVVEQIEKLLGYY